MHKIRATGKCNLPLVIPSVLIFIRATVVRLRLFESRIDFNVIAFRILSVYGTACTSPL
jgi:hypothetical protein